MLISNKLYKYYFNQYNKLKWVTRTEFGASSIQWKIDGVFKNKFNELLMKAYVEKYPKKKKLPSIDKIYDKELELVEIVKNKLSPVAMKYYEHKLKKFKLIERVVFLNEIKIELTDEYNLLETSNSGTYSSQGYGSYKYARESLKKYEVILSAFNIPYEVKTRVINHNFPESNHYAVRSTKYYELYAKCDAHVLFYLTVNNPLSEDELIKLCWDNGVHPLVIFPNLNSEKVYNYEFNRK
ncbi:MAG: hypothetical protein KDH96_04515 [Candidatus Riesia sp.]|nr:hypothetical protein [Candidatus Riesia sp.]